MENGLGGPANVDLIVLGRVEEWEAPEVQVLRKIRSLQPSRRGRREGIRRAGTTKTYCISHFTILWGVMIISEMCYDRS